MPDTSEIKGIDDILARHVAREGALLVILQDVQSEFGMISETAMTRIAKALNLSAAEVLGVVSFYHDLKTEPQARHVLKICRGEACQMRGARTVIAAAEGLLGCQMHQKSADGLIALDEVFCLGLCANGPAGQVDGTPVAALTTDTVAAHLARWRA